MSINNEYLKWRDKTLLDPDLLAELKKMNNEQISDAFYRDLEFGTGGLRGIIGAGTNRMNVYTVARATQGICNYIHKHYKKELHQVAISYDSRIKSDLFSQITAQVFAANKIKVYLFPHLSPVPTLSYATRYLNCSIGIMITASHNPSLYNGYKVYGIDGCQITTEAADEILENINSLDYFNSPKFVTLDEGFCDGFIEYIKPDVITSFLKEIKSQSLLGNSVVNKNVSIVYSPLNGTGLIPILRVLREEGFHNIHVVKEQQFPNGYFPTCPYPNPEIKDALKLGLEYCKTFDADLMLATDPDCDRVGIAVRNANGEHVLLSGNEVGLLLLDYICSRRIVLNLMPKNPIMVKTIVTMDLAEKIASSYGVKTINVLTGFKFIGEQIGLLEKKGQLDSYIFGFEESYGYLTGTYVRDKDGVNAAYMICEMFAYYKTQGISLLEKLDEIRAKYGYCLNTLHSFEFKGQDGFLKMNKIMDKFRKEFDSVNGMKVIKKLDYSLGIDGLPKSNVLKFYLEDNSSIVVRPSGTEPKLKIYLSVQSSDKQSAKIIESQINDDLNKYLV